MNDQSSNEKQNTQSENENSKKRGVFKSYLHYGFNPQLGERFKQLGYYFGHFAYLLAMIYGAVRLIRPNHPILNPANIGQYGFKDVISTAAENVKMTRDNVDQVLVFFTVLFGLALMILQVFGIVIMVAVDQFIVQANAQPLTSLFTVENPSQDLALQGLELVFGTDMFGAGIPQYPIVTAFHSMLALFSSVALIIGIFLLIYYVFVVVSEAAMTGTPFGRRFNGLWAPIRLVVAFGLLIPVAGGLNTAQYITLYMAKMGSNLASNAWGTFSTTFLNPQNFVAVPTAGKMQEVLGYIFVSELCRYAYDGVNQRPGMIKVRARLPKAMSPQVSQMLNDASSAMGTSITGDLAQNAANYASNAATSGNYTGATLGGALAVGSASLTGAEALIRGGRSIYGNSPLALGWESVAMSDVGSRMNNAGIMQNKFDIQVHWTKRDNPNRSPDNTCGSIKFHFVPTAENAVLPADVLIAMRSAYLDATEDIINILQSSETAFIPGTDNVLHSVACMVAKQDIPRCPADSDQYQDQFDNISGLPARLTAEAHALIELRIRDALSQLSSASDELNSELTERGWAAAGAHFNIIAAINGAVYDAANDGLPSTNSEPTIIYAAEATINPLRPRRFLAFLNKANPFGGEDTEDAKVVRDVISEGGTWFADASEATSQNSCSGFPGASVGEFLCGMIQEIFGGGILDMRDDLSLNPMGQLAMGGKGLIKRSIFAYLTIAGLNVAAASGGAIPIIGGAFEAASQVIAIWAVPIASFMMTIGLGAGFVLYFMVPLLPFMYFLFAVVGWISEIFEAIVAMPLWALAHVRIDGDGLPGQAASTGYYLIFAIFTRPIFIVFGLIGSYLSFMVGVYLLHFMFDIAVDSLDNEDGFFTAVFDSIGFTVIYVIIVYNMANTSFQMIDQVPNQIMRWFGSSAPGFSDGRQVDMGAMQQFGAAATGFLGRDLGQSAAQKYNANKQQREKDREEKGDNKKKAEAVGRLYGGGDPKKTEQLTKKAQDNLNNGLEATEGIRPTGSGGQQGGGGGNKSSGGGSSQGGGQQSGGDKSGSGGGDQQRKGKPRTRKRRTKKPPKK